MTINTNSTKGLIPSRTVVEGPGVGPDEMVTEEYASLNSVEARMTSKGDFQITVKIYGQSPSSLANEIGNYVEHAIASLGAKGLRIAGKG